MKTPIAWMPVMGRMDQRKDSIIFKGGKIDIPGQEQEGSEIGLFLCNRTFSEGSIAVDVRFDDVSPTSCADIVLFYDPQNRYTLNAGLTYQNLFAIRHFDTRWTIHATAGAVNAIEAKRTYRLEASLRGSTVALKCDGVEVLRVVLPFVLPQSQVGVFGVDRTNIEFKNFLVSPVKPRAFVVMQFSAPYNDVYSEVIKQVCDEEEVDVTRIDEEAGPGLIIQDINRTIRESKIIIADISPINANVFYEVGFAHALNKPTILLAEKGTKLPFDVSPFRTLFYENSIGGKRLFEEGLRKHIRACLQQKG
jgi:hypothetical protein